MSTDSDRFLDHVARLLQRGPERLSQLGAGIIIAANEALASDSRAFSRTFGIEHALVLRECNILARELQLLTIERRDERTQRLFYVLSDAGEALLAYR